MDYTKEELTYQEELQKAQELVQKQLQQIEKINSNLNPESRANLFKFSFGAMLVGNTNSGKTYSIYQQLSDPAYKILERISNQNCIFIISPTHRIDKTMRLIKDLLIKEKDFDTNTQCFEDPMQGIQMVTQRIKEQTHQAEQGLLAAPLLLIIDDCLTSFKNKEFVKFLELISTRGRHANLNYYVCSQSYKSINNTFRRNSNIIQLHNCNLATEITSFCDELRSHLTKQQMQDMYNKVINSPGHNYILVAQRNKASERFILNAESVILI